jgi:hypothetical protein
MIIFKQQRNDPSLLVGAPPKSLVEVSESSYINSELFVKWLNHFINHVKPTTEKKVLLVLDGHTMHSNNSEAVEIACKNGVILLQLWGHTSHCLKPSDIAILKPLETLYE